jgi:hypothetical protein
VKYLWQTIVLARQARVPLGISIVGGSDQRDRSGRFLPIRIVKVAETFLISEHDEFLD